MPHSTNWFFTFATTIIIELNIVRCNQDLNDFINGNIIASVSNSGYHSLTFPILHAWHPSKRLVLRPSGRELF